MKISIGADHKGVEHKKAIINYLQNKGFLVYDEGPNTLDSVDYPDYAKKVAKKVTNKEVDFGILICYTGIGMSMSANKVKGIRAALVSSVENAHLTREHNNANVLCLAAKDTPVDYAKQIVDEFLNTEFAGGRHERRVNKVMEIEE